MHNETTREIVEEQVQVVDNRCENGTLIQTKAGMVPVEEIKTENEIITDKTGVSEKNPDIPGITHEKTKRKILSLLKENKKIAAIQLYRMACASKMTDAIILIEKYWRDVALANLDRSNYPNKCCLNCIGACGDLKRLIERFGEALWDVKGNCAIGKSCQEFISEKELEESISSKRLKIIFEKLNRNSKFVILLNGRIYKTYIINRNKRISNEQTILIENDKILDYIKIKIINQLENDSKIENFLNSCEELNYKGVKLEDSDKTWNDYVKRVDSQIKQIKINTQNLYISMSDEEASVFIKEELIKNGNKAHLDLYNGDIERFCIDFFPNKSLQEIAMSIATHKMG